MKIQQEQHEFKPITIKFETYSEASNFFNAIDKVLTGRDLSNDEASIFIRLSDAQSNIEVVI